MIILKFLGIIILIGILFIAIPALILVFRFFGLFRQLTGKGDNRQNGQSNPFGQQGGQWYNPNGQQQSQGSSASGSTVSGGPKPRNSEIDKNEGEYVEFEEIP